MIKYLQLPFSFDRAALQRDTLQIGEQFWKLHFQVKHYSGEWSAIPLRSIDGKTDNGFISPEENDCYKDTALLLSSTYLRDVLKHFECPLLSVRLLKLAAGARVHEHKDRDLCYEEGLVRFHIPVFTNPDVDFYLGGEKMILEEGSCWYMNFNLPHSLHNKSNQDRIHLVVDARVNQWVQDLFLDTPDTDKKVIADQPKHSRKEQLLIIEQLRSLNTDTSKQLADEMEKNLSPE
ncbi:MAG: aspartyl/asparaginyl beta-hydroxylase domain-containing protein [Chitinophagaceae bacterium]|nr:aspartyl/asparaginyl beta-hydroxylase domain-containing protein [Chitinophagaceae bacterium]